MSWNIMAQELLLWKQFGCRTNECWIQLFYGMLCCNVISVFSLQWSHLNNKTSHYSDVKMNAIASQITCVSMVCWIVCSGAHQRRHRNSTSLAFLREIHLRLVDSPHKGPVTWKMFPFEDVNMSNHWQTNCLFNRLFQLMGKIFHVDFQRATQIILCIHWKILFW